MESESVGDGSGMEYFDKFGSFVRVNAHVELCLIIIESIQATGQSGQILAKVEGVFAILGWTEDVDGDMFSSCQ